LSRWGPIKIKEKRSGKDSKKPKNKSKSEVLKIGLQLKKLKRESGTETHRPV